MAMATVHALRPRPPAPRPEPKPRLAGRRDPARPSRRVGPAGRVVVLGTACLVLWAVLAAPALRRAAETSPLGARRTAALALLRPLARLSAFFGLDRPQHGMDAALGRATQPSVPRSFPHQEPAPLPSSTAPGLPVPHASSPGATPGGTPSPTPSAARSTQPPASVAPVLPTPTKDNRLRVLVVGDSLAADLGIGISRVLDGSRFVAKVDARESTGLARPDYFDWPAQTAADVSRFHPDVVVAMFGANDNQGVLVGDSGIAFGTSEWRTEYARRVGALMRSVTSSGPAVVWVGMPTMSSASLANSMRGLNDIYRSQAARHADVVYVDTWALFSGPNGRYTAFLPNGSGQQELVRQPDGVHLTAAGDVRLAGYVFVVLEGLWEPSPPVKQGGSPPSTRDELRPSAPGPDGRLVD
jgi:uncharacterized protein